MGMSTYMYGRTERTAEQLEQYERIAEAYKIADLELPEAIQDFLYADPEDIMLEEKQVGDDGRDIWQIDVDTLVEKNVKYVYFVNSY